MSVETDGCKGCSKLDKGCSIIRRLDEIVDWNLNIKIQYCKYKTTLPCRIKDTCHARIEGDCKGSDPDCIIYVPEGD